MCVLLSHFSLRCEVLRNPAIEGQAVIIIYGTGSRKLVLDYSPELEGLQRDIPLQEALSRYDRAEIVQADIPYYGTVFNRILDNLETRSPLVEGPEPGIAYLDIDGLQYIYPEDIKLVEAVREVIPESFSSQIGIAIGKFPAYLAAGCSPSGGYKILTGDISQFMAGLPCDILPVSLKTKRRLGDFGIKTLGRLAAMPEGPLQSQFGPEGRLMWELARGNDDTPLYPRLWEEILENSATLTSVTVSLETMLAAFEGLLTPVFAQITVKGLGIGCLNLWTRTWDSERWERKIQFKEPAVDLKATLSRVRQVMEDFPQPGPVEEVGIKITRLAYCRGHQKSLFRDVRNHDNLLEDIHQLELRQGATRVFKLKEVEPWSRIPERRYALTPTVR
jgi:DNA polymerase IV